MRVSSSGDQMAGGGRLRDAGARPRRVVAAAGPNMAGIVTGVNLGSDRSSGEVGNGAVGHGGANGWVLRPPGDVLSTVRHSVAALSDSGHGGDMAGGAGLSCSMGTVAREGNRARGERGSAEELTARSMSSSACSGEAGRRQSISGDLGVEG